MSLSKSIKHYHRCVCCLTPKRSYNVQSASQLPSEKSDEGKMSSSQLRAMSVNQWKLLTYLRDYLTKASPEAGFTFTLTKEWASILMKVPSIRSMAQDHKSIENAQSLSAVSDKPNANEVPAINKETVLVDPIPRVEQPPSPAPKPKPDNSRYSQVLAGLKKLGNNLPMNSDNGNPSGNGELVVQEKAKWRNQKDLVSTHTISSRTRHVISAVATAGTPASLLKRTEDLLHHINQFPQARGYAVKEGAVRVLLKVRKESSDAQTLALVRETLTTLGYVDPVQGQGIRVLSIDGGGIRGVLVIEMLKKLEELTGKRVYELFDYICGVSTGAILAGVLAPQRISLTEVSSRYKELSTKIFSQNAFWGTSNLVWSHAYYDTTMWEDMLRTYVGDTKLIHTSRDPLCPKFSTISSVVNRERVSAFVFRNYELQHRIHSQYQGSSQYSIWEAVRASSSAPTYFEEFQLDDMLHQDGGIYVNNPTAVAIHEARLLWPGVPLQCVVSFGTGRCNPIVSKDVKPTSAVTSSWRNKFNKILDSATDTEAVHTLLNDLVPGSVYYRFNPYLTEMISMVEIRPEKIDQLELDAEMYYRRNEEKFKEAAQSLLRPRSTSQKACDWIGLQANMLGIKSNL